MDNSIDRELVIMAIQQCCDIIFSSSSDDSEDDSYEYVAQCLETKTAIPRLQNYVETIVPQFNDGQFKSHFRLEGFYIFNNIIVSYFYWIREDILNVNILH